MHKTANNNSFKPKILNTMPYFSTTNIYHESWQKATAPKKDYKGWEIRAVARQKRGQDSQAIRGRVQEEAWGQEEAWRHEAKIDLFCKVSSGHVARSSVFFRFGSVFSGLEACCNRGHNRLFFSVLAHFIFDAYFTWPLETLAKSSNLCDPLDFWAILRLNAWSSSCMASFMALICRVVRAFQESS